MYVCKLNSLLTNWQTIQYSLELFEFDRSNVRCVWCAEQWRPEVFEEDLGTFDSLAVLRWPARLQAVRGRRLRRSSGQGHLFGVRRLVLSVGLVLLLLHCTTAKRRSYDSRHLVLFFAHVTGWLLLNEYHGAPGWFDDLVEWSTAVAQLPTVISIVWATF